MRRPDAIDETTSFVSGPFACALVSATLAVTRRKALSRQHTAHTSYGRFHDAAECSQIAAGRADAGQWPAQNENGRTHTGEVLN